MNIKGNLVFILFVGFAAWFAMRFFARRKDRTDLTAHYEKQEQLQRINRISQTVENNAAPAMATVGELPWRTANINPLFQGGLSSTQIPLQVNDTSPISEQLTEESWLSATDILKSL